MMRLIFLCFPFLLMLSGCGSLDLSSPEATGKTFFDLMVADDESSIRNMLPTEADYEEMMKNPEIPERVLKEAKANIEENMKDMHRAFRSDYKRMCEGRPFKQNERSDFSFEKVVFKDRSGKGQEKGSIFIIFAVDGDRYEIGMGCIKTSRGWLVVPEIDFGRAR